MLPNQVTSNLSMALQSLFDLGARNFLIPNLPDLGETPLAHNLNQLFPSASSQLSALTAEHNLLLEQTLDSLKVLPGINITTLDVNSLVRDTMNNPMEFGFTTVQNSCLTNFQPGFNFDGVCENPDEFLFWDDVHPTAASHKFISQLAIETLKEEEPAGVPEPASALSLLAFGAFGAGAMVKHKDKKEGAIKRS